MLNMSQKMEKLAFLLVSTYWYKINKHPCTLPWLIVIGHNNVSVNVNLLKSRDFKLHH